MRALNDPMQRRPARILFLIGALIVVAGVAAFLLLPPDLNGTAWQLEFLPSAGISRLRIVHAAGPLYVATTGSDAGNACTNSASPCATVQHAVDVAALGDEIRVAAGVYTGVNARPANDLFTTGVVTQVVYISKTVTIRGSYSGDFSNWNPEAHLTTLDAQGQGRVLYITGDISPTIDGLRIIGGNAENLGGWPIGDAGGGMYVISATVTFNNNQVFNNTANRPGGGLFVSDGKVTLNNNTIISNTSEAGGGVAMVRSEAILSRNAIISNAADTGGGLGWAYSYVTLLGNTIRSNTAEEGGGVAWVTSIVTLLGNTIISNTAQSGGGVHIASGGTGSLDGNIIQGNQALGTGSVFGTTGGGGVVVLESSITFTNTVVRNNQATLGSPGILVYRAVARLLHATVADNLGGSGSGIELLLGSAAALTNTILVSHTVGISVSASSIATLNGVLWFGNNFPIGGPGNINVANAFTGAPAFAADGYHLTPGSAAIDRGMNAGVATDIDGQPRIMPPDLGADEYVLTTYLPVISKNFGP